MKKTPALILTAAVLAVLAAYAAFRAAKTPVEEAIEPLTIGAEVDDFMLIDAREKQPASLGDYGKAAAFALIFIGVECEASNAYMSRLSELHQAYQEKGVQFLAVNSNEEEMFSAVEAHAEARQLPFPVLKDTNNALADQLKAVATPEVFLLEPVRHPPRHEAETSGETTYILRYSGAVDDSEDPKKAANHFLKEALDALLSGEAVVQKRVKPKGSPIDRVDKDAKPKATP